MKNIYGFACAALLAGCAASGSLDRSEYLDKVLAEVEKSRYNNNVYNDAKYHIVGHGECKPLRPERPKDAEREKVLRYTASNNMTYDSDEEKYLGMKKVGDALAENGIRAEAKATRVHDGMVYFTVAYEEAADRSKIDLLLINKFGGEFNLERLNRESRDRTVENSVCRSIALSSAVYDAKERAETLGVKLKFPVKINESDYAGRVETDVWYYFE
ncbi:MAG: hypothetical protein LBI17_00175 [Rickettsiales bacterium]|nr:hypothetical protein [Rickettsiales bacterium]